VGGGERTGGRRGGGQGRWKGGRGKRTGGRWEEDRGKGQTARQAKGPVHIPAGVRPVQTHETGS